jgi:hypothetical protein
MQIVAPLLAYLKKWAYQITSLSVCLSLTNHEIWYGGNVIQGDFSAIIINPIASIILKLLRFKVVG